MAKTYTLHVYNCQFKSDYLALTDDQVVEDLIGKPANESDSQWRGLTDKDPNRAIRILYRLAEKRFFSLPTWGLSLEYLLKEKTAADCLKLFASYLGELDATFQSLHLAQLTYLIDMVTRTPGMKPYDSSFLFQLWDQLIVLCEQQPVDSDKEPVFTAMNSPIGHMTQGLLRVIRALSPNSYDEITNHLRARLEMLISGNMPAHHLARVMIAHSIAWLYQLKRGLVLPSFLARFDWTNPNEAKGMW